MWGRLKRFSKSLWNFDFQSGSLKSRPEARALWLTSSAALLQIPLGWFFFDWTSTELNPFQFHRRGRFGRRGATVGPTVWERASIEVKRSVLVRTMSLRLWMNDRRQSISLLCLLLNVQRAGGWVTLANKLYKADGCIKWFSVHLTGKTEELFLTFSFGLCSQFARKRPFFVCDYNNLLLYPK